MDSVQHALTPRTQRLIGLADDIARRYGAPGQWDLALLIGMMEDRAGIAATILSYLGLQVQTLYKLLPAAGEEPLEGSAASAAPDAVLPQLLDAAAPVATEAGMSQIGTEHLLIVLARQHDSAAGKALAAAGITETAIRDAAGRLWP